MDTGADWIVFEQPLTERIRMLLRLEFLFNEYAHHCKDDTVWGIRSGLNTMLDVFSVIGRADLRTELMKDFGDQIGILTRLRSRPEVDHARLDQVLGELRAAGTALQNLGGVHPGQLLRENEFLFAVLNRSAIPGGNCAFDLPAYHRWLSRPRSDTLRDLQNWFAPLRPLDKAIALYLRLLRESTQPKDEVAEGGVHLHIPQASSPLIRVLLSPAADVFPEISAGKHRISIRFMRLGDVNARNVQANNSIPFRLQCCQHHAGTA